MWYQRKQNKYNSKRTTTNFGQFDSKKEAAYAGDLELMLRAKQIKGYERQVTFDLRGLNGTKVCATRVDFLVEMPDGSKEVHEVKSKMTASLRDWQIKRNLFEDNYPDIRYIVIN